MYVIEHHLSHTSLAFFYNQMAALDRKTFDVYGTKKKIFEITWFITRSKIL